MVGPWQVWPKILEHSPPTLRNVDGGPPGPHGGSDPHLGSKRCVVNMHGYDSVVSLNPPMSVDRQHESQEAQSPYPLTLHLTRGLRLEFVGHAT
jgi:hypothetical protein